jgi:FdhE protein
VALPDAESRAHAYAHGMPPLPAQHWIAPTWQQTLRIVIDVVRPDATAPARASLARLASKPPQQQDALAARVLRAELHGEDGDLLPFVAAALQVEWTAAAATLGSDGMRPLDVEGFCPCCGSRPVASVVRGHGDVANLRFLHCSLCNTEWNLTRVRCAACGSDAHISYRHLAGQEARGPAMRAETCDDCGSYLKILYREPATQGDPVADDLATLALDLLVDAAGYRRAGPNLLFVAGDVPAPSSLSPSA